MPLFKVHAQQWVKEVGELEIEANNKKEALRLAEDEDFDWSDGDDSKDFEILEAELVAGEEPDEEEEDEEDE